MKRFILLLISFLTSIQLVAQSQYDYYGDENVWGGVDSAIKGLKTFGIIILVIVAIIVVGIIGAYTMDLFFPPKKNSLKSKIFPKRIQESQ